MDPVYKIIGWSRKNDMGIGSCIFSIELDACFAQKARNLHFEGQRIFEKNIREIVGYEYAQAMFLDETAFLRWMSVRGDCACLGVSGDVLESDWTDEDVITYNGHNVDNKTQAFDLLTIFTQWVDVVEALTYD